MRIPSDSAPDVTYDVIWEYRNGEIFGSCTCPAGVNRRWCKHLARTVTEIPVHLEETRLGRLIADHEACRAKFDAFAKRVRDERRRETAAITRQMQEFLPYLD